MRGRYFLIQFIQTRIPLKVEIINGKKAVRLPYMDIVALDNEIARFELTKDIFLSMEMAMEMVEACTHLYEGKLYRSLKIVRHKMQISDEVLAYLASDARKSLIKAEAVVVNSSTLKFFGNFYLKIKRPVIKTKIFDDESDAVKWLLNF